MERRKFLIGAGSLAAGSAAALGTGAFSSVSAKRGIRVKIVKDKFAYLTLKDTSEYADTRRNGQLELDFNKNSQGGIGLNSNASTEFIGVFDIENRGTNTVKTWIDLSSIEADLDGGTMSVFAEGPTASLHYDSTQETPNAPPANVGVVLDPGEKVGVCPTFRDIAAQDYLNGEIIIYAAAEDSQRFPNVDLDAEGTIYKNGDGRLQ